MATHDRAGDIPDIPASTSSLLVTQQQLQRLGLCPGSERRRMASPMLVDDLTCGLLRLEPTFFNTECML